MARVWIYDRNRDESYAERVQKAKSSGRTPPGRWRVYYYDKSGRMRTEIHRNKSKAESRRGKLETELQSGTWVDPAAAKAAVVEMAEKWIDSRHDLKPTTWWKYRSLLDNHVLPEWGGRALDSVTGEDIDVWIGKLLKAKNDGGSGLGASQARHAYRVLAMVLGWCVPERLPRNPAAKANVPIPDEAEHVYLTYGQVEALADAAGELRTKYSRPTACAGVNRVLILLLAYTGLRWGEAAALRRHRVDLDQRRLRVATTFYEVNGVQAEGLPKTGKRRTVPIPASLVPDLENLLDRCGEKDLIFTTAKGLSLRSHNWRVREFNAALPAAKLSDEGLTPHKLRHTAASLAIAAGADVKVLQQMLGHADASMTLNIYGHLFPDRLDEVATILDGRRATALAQRGTAA